MCFSATLIASGSGVGVVVVTGNYTEIGTIKRLVNKVEEKKTAVLEQINTVSKYLAMLIVLTAIFTWCVAFFKLEADWLEALSISLVCAVAMIPEGLEAIVTVTYVWAVSNMAKQNAIIRALPAVETLGSVTTICSDKTGTLTQNLISLTAFVTSNARYKCDVDSRERTVKNFVRDDTYNAERADHANMIKANAAKKGGSSSKNGGANDSSYTMANDNQGKATNKTTAATDSYPVGQGESPDLTFFRNALAGGVLCSKCTLGKDGGREGEIGNPTELSILRACYWAGIEVNPMKDASPIIAIQALILERFPRLRTPVG